ncbi:MAG: hypothetical protein KIT79_02510 [Deltaproteobacteria bacterium]|nr:hypothetical protein [Deltaproteobacteria bacterium]
MLRKPFVRIVGLVPVLGMAVLMTGCFSHGGPERVSVPIQIVTADNAGALTAQAFDPDELCSGQVLPEYIRFRFTDIGGEEIARQLERGELSEDELGRLTTFVNRNNRSHVRRAVYLNPYLNPLPFEGDSDVVGSTMLPAADGGAGLSAIFLLPPTEIRIEFTAWVRSRVSSGSSTPQYSVIPELCEGEATVDITGDGQVILIEARRAAGSNLTVGVTSTGDNLPRYAGPPSYGDYPYPERFVHIGLVDQDTGYGFPVRNISDDQYNCNDEIVAALDGESCPNSEPDEANVFPDVPVGRDYRFMAWYPGRHPEWGNSGFVTSVSNAGKYGVSVIRTHTDTPPLTETGISPQNIPIGALVAEIDFDQDQPLRPWIPALGLAVDLSVANQPDKTGIREALKSFNVCNLTGLSDGNSGFLYHEDCMPLADSPDPLPAPPQMAFMSGVYAWGNSGFGVDPTEDVSSLDITFQTIEARATSAFIPIPAPDPEGLDTGVIQPDYGNGLADSFCVYTTFYSSGNGLPLVNSARPASDPTISLPVSNFGSNVPGDRPNGTCQPPGGVVNGKPVNIADGISFQTRRTGGPSTNSPTTVAAGEGLSFNFTIPASVVSGTPNPSGNIVIVAAPSNSGDRPVFEYPIVTCPYTGSSASCSSVDLSSWGGSTLRAYTSGQGHVPSSGFVTITVTNPGP